MKAVEFRDKTRNVFPDDIGGLPGTISRTITLPIDKILELGTEVTGIENCIH